MSSSIAIQKPTELEPTPHARSFFTFVSLLAAIPFALALLLLAAIWGTLLWHYHVPQVKVDMSTVQAARISPPDSIFDELRELHATTPPWNTDGEVMRIADGLLAGRVVTIGSQQISRTMALAPEAADNVPLGAMLSLAAMEPVQVLLRAYQLSGDSRYLLLSKEIILKFDAWDRDAWLPQGLAWNDHAVAARVQVLTDFWGVYRRGELYDAQEARRILELVARCGRRLYDDRDFNVATNHGVMQNIALLEIAIAFPQLPGAADYGAKAASRLNTQTGFYISDEGVILEHSAFYHHFGLRLLTVASRMLHMLNAPVPDSWQTKYNLAQDFYREMQRPDGSLPQFGDTHSGPESFSNTHPDAKPRTEASPDVPRRSFALYPVSGYSISWSGLEHWPDATNLSQTVVTWSDFPSGSHKHADDLSVLVWAAGQSWWTNVGYWPYGDPGRGPAEGWTASNAPHLFGERKPSDAPALLGSGVTKSLRFLDVVRVASGTVTIRRQVVEIQPSQWIVVDSTTGGSKQVVTSWNTAAVISVHSEGNNCYQLISSTVGRSMETCLTSGTRATPQLLSGSMQPFAGWQVVDHSPVPSNALLVMQPTGSWSVNSFRLLNKGVQGSSAPAVVRWHGPELWTVTLAEGSEVSRAGNKVEWKNPNSSEALTVTPPAPDVSRRSAQIRDNYFSAVRQYPKFEESFSTRRKLTMLLLTAVLCSTLALVVSRRVLSRFYPQVVGLVAILWSVGALTILVRFKPIF